MVSFSFLFFDFRFVHFLFQSHIPSDFQWFVVLISIQVPTRSNYLNHYLSTRNVYISSTRLLLFCATKLPLYFVILHKLFYDASYEPFLLLVSIYFGINIIFFFFPEKMFYSSSPCFREIEHFLNYSLHVS